MTSVGTVTLAIEAYRSSRESVAAQSARTSVGQSITSCSENATWAGVAAGLSAM